MADAPYRHVKCNEGALLRQFAAATLLWLSSTVALAGTPGTTADVIHGPVKPTAQAPTGTIGFSLSHMDRSVDPRQDFYAHANGKWLKALAIPEPSPTSAASRCWAPIWLASCSSWRCRPARIRHPYQRQRDGLAASLPLERQAVQALTMQLFHPLSQLYVQRYYTDTTRREITKMVGHIKTGARRAFSHFDDPVTLSR